MSIPSYRLINPQANRCFVFKWEPFGLTTPWHYHPELELIYFIDGKTSGIIGDGFEEFDEGDLVLLGADFPHVLQEHVDYKNMNNKKPPFGLIIQFVENFLGQEFITKPELEPIIKLFREAKRGLKFNPDVIDQVSDKLLNLHLLNDTRKLISLLDILTILSESKDYTYLTSNSYNYSFSYDEDRMKNINEYLYQHFKDPISMEEIASVSNMTVTSFCRYFKSRTLKTFTQFLNELRISYACKLLNKENYSVMDSCFECGYNSLSYFNRQFKAIMKMSPMQYKTWKLKAIKREEAF
jgi:AraC-like DNA-binding protein